MKKTVLTYLSIAFLLCSPFRILGQSNQTDSLARLFEKNRNADLGLQLAESFLSISTDSAMYYVEKLDFSLLTEEQKIQYLIFKGDLFRSLLKFDSAVSYFTKSLVILDEHPNAKVEANVHDEIGATYIDLREANVALSYFEKAIEIRRNNSLLAELPKSYYALGNVLFRQKNIQDAIKTYKKGISSIEGNSQISLLASLYYMLGNSYNRPTNADSALFYFQKAKELYDEVGPPQMKIAVSNELVQLLMLENKMSEAIPVLQENLVTIQAFNDWQYYSRTYSLLVKAYEGIGDYRSALSYQKQKYDTVLNFFANQKTQSVAKITEDYRTDKQLDEAEEEAFFATRRAKVFGIVIIVMIVVMIITYLLFTRAIQKKKLENLQAMVLGEENERKRVAKDLHDGIGVLLTSVKLRLSNFQDKVDAKDDFKKSLDQIDNACTEVRRISHNMIPASLTKLGLQEAILDLLDNVQASTDIIIEEALNYEEGAYDESQEVLIYRVVQELINNSLKYADPTKLSIELAKSKQDYVLTFKDDGKGFEKSKVKSGLGLRSIASRVDILKGKLTFETAPGQGAIFNITIPHYG